MNKAYNRINWENYPSDSTPLNEDNLNKMDIAINEVDNRVISLETTKLPVATAYTMVKDVEFDEKTGVFTITKLNGSVIKIDTALEKISTNFRFDYSTQKLILTLIDGTTQEVDLSALLTQYEFTDSDTIAFTIDTSGKVVASVKKGSITQDMLEPNYLANVKVEVAKAESASLSADTSAKNAKTSENNAKTSEEKAREYAEVSSGIGALISSFATGTNPTIQDSTNAPLIYGKFKGYTLQDGTPTPDNPVEINGLAKDGAIEVKTTGKNLLKNTATTTTKDGITYTVDENGIVTVNGTSTKDTDLDVFPWQVITPQKYKVVGCPTGGGAYKLQCNNPTLKEVNRYAYDTGNGVELTVSELEEGKKNIVVRIYISANTTVNNLVFKPMLTTDLSATYDDFVEYQETVANIPITEPLYEGDYIEIYADGSGKLVRAMAEVVFDGSETWAYWTNNSTANYFYATLASLGCMDAATDNSRACAYSSHFKGVERNNLPSSFEQIATELGGNQKSYLYFNTQVATSEAEWKAWLQSNPVTVVYELAEPTETPLTAEQVAQFKQLYTFEPVTNVFCDGEVEVLYYKNTDNGETVGIVHKKVEKNERAVNSVNDYYSSFKQTFDTVVGGAVSNNTSNVEYTEPSFSSGSIIQTITRGGSLVNGLKSATAKIAETLSSMCDFFIGKIAYNIGDKGIIEDFDYENWIVERAEGGGIEYPSNTLERFERLIAQCVEASIKLNDSLPIIEHGTLTLTGTGEIVTQTINFAKSFSVKPTVIVSIQRPDTTYYFDGKVAVYGVEVDRFSIHSQSPVGIVNIIHWIAIA